MGANTKIEWAHHTVNFWWGCAKVSPACEHCYAEKLAKFFRGKDCSWGPRGKRWSRWQQAEQELKALDETARKRGVVERVFINSMSDTFEGREDLDPARAVLFETVARLTNLQALLLTKRPENVARMVPFWWLADWPAHVWVGATVENQAMADLRVPELLKIPAKVRFLSCEPLLGPVDMDAAFGDHWCPTCRRHYAVAGASTACTSCGEVYEGLDTCPKCGHEDYESECPGCGLFGDERGLDVNDVWLKDGGGETIQWVIAGGESGPKARAMEPAWARGLRDQCQAAKVPFFFKQWGEFGPVEDRVMGMRDGVPVAETVLVPVRVGKKAAGRLLDGREWNEVPRE